MKTKIHANIRIATDFYKTNLPYFSNIHSFSPLLGSFA